jgi:replicative DNA helicase
MKAETMTFRREQAFIGAVILNHDQHVLVDLDPADFENQTFAGIWAYCRDRKSIDMTAINHKFPGALLADAVSAVPSMANLKKCAGHVRDLAYRRRLSAALTKASQLVQSGDSISTVANFVVSSLDGAPSDSEAQHITDLVFDAYRQLEAAQLHGDQVNFVQTGMGRFDSVIGGLQKDGLIIVAGRPSMGKTAFASCLARNAGKNGPVLMVSMEMSGEQLAMRFLASEYNIDLQHMMQGKLNVDGWSRLSNASEALNESNLWINDKTSRTVADVAAEARRFKRKHGSIELLIVDYLTLLKMPQGESRANVVGEVSRAFKVLAGELKCPVVLLSQLNRKLEDRPKNDRVPRMSDLRDSGSIEQDADQIIFPFRPEVYDRKPENHGLAEIIIAKNRNGKTGKITMEWLQQSATFRDFDSREDF